MNFEFDNERPIYIQIVEEMEKLIISGKFTSGEKLPSVRDLALMIKVNPNTMQKALVELENRKLIYTERTNGKYISKDGKLINKVRENYAKSIAEKFLSEMESLGLKENEIINYLKNMGEI